MRFAIDGTVRPEERLRCDVVIIGAGIAGLYTALNIGEKYSCCILAKETIDISNSWLAQGGIAAAIASDDKPNYHYEDTLIAGAGLCDKEAVRILVDEGPDDVRRLVSMHVPFDLNEDGELQITREGGHRKNRIVHAGGDATGREAVKALAHLVSLRPNVKFAGMTCLCDLLLGDHGAVTGIVVRHDDHTYQIIETNHVVIATGGIGQVYKISTNPSVATGDGMAAAMRAGASVSNLEFIQFHPTGLWSPNAEDRAFLISEAVRGEGGLLKNKEGVRFMEGAHELNELAPRDIVARAIVRELERSGEDHVFVDITAEDAEFLEHRFPTIYHECMRRGIDISKDWIPVCPVQHYLMGGIVTDMHGRTNVPGLYACGEAACTGVHGANRLASNSMLECLVFGRRAAEYITRDLDTNPPRIPAEIPEIETRRSTDMDLTGTRKHIQQLMNDYGCVIRNGDGMEKAAAELDSILAELESSYRCCNEYFELLSVATVARAILTAALARKGSIGSHYRDDNIK